MTARPAPAARWRRRRGSPSRDGCWCCWRAPSAPALHAAAETRLAALGVGAQLRTLGASALARVLATAAEAGGGILVMSADSPLLAEPQAERALEQARLPVLLVRPAAS